MPAPGLGVPLGVGVTFDGAGAFAPFVAKTGTGRRYIVTLGSVVKAMKLLFKAGRSLDGLKVFCAPVQDLSKVHGQL